MQPYTVDADFPFGEQIPPMENTHPLNWEYILQMENEYLKLLSSFVFFFSIATYSPFGEQILQMENKFSKWRIVILQNENLFSKWRISTYTLKVQPYTVDADSPFGEQMENTHSPNWEHILQVENEYLYPQTAALYTGII